nr:hypothetical protein [Tanacetum cinerariifolium]
SAGAGSILRRVRSAKVSGRVCERVDRSLVDFRGGKRVSAAPANDEISQVLFNIKAGSGIINEHTSMEDVVNTGVVHENSQDGIACNKGGRGFVFGKNEVSNGILNSPVGPFLRLILVISPLGTEEIVLKMEYVPNYVSKLENGNRRISFSAEEVYKCGQSCALQLYGYFIGTSMDYRVVR